MKRLFLLLMLAEVTLAFPFDLTQKLQTLASLAAVKYNCSISIAVRSSDDLVAVADGITDFQAQTKAEVTDKYAWGSGTKMHTAASIMNLISKGAFSLDDTVGSLLDGILGKMQFIDPHHDFSKVVELWGKPLHRVTIRQLLSMQGTFHDFDTAYPGRLDEPNADALRAAIYTHPQDLYTPTTLMSVPWVRKKFKRGFHYSSTNFLLLGLVLAQHAGDSDWKDLDQTKFLPDYLKGAITFANDGTPVSHGVVHGYDRTSFNMLLGQNDLDVGDVKGVFVGWTASNIIGSAAAMANLTWDIYAVYSFAPKPLIDQLLPIPHTTYGLGTFDMEYITGQKGEYGWGYGHFGSTYGYQSGVAYFPAFNFTLAVATNLETDDMAHLYLTMCQAYNTVANSLLNVDMVCTLKEPTLCECTPQIELLQEEFRRQALNLCTKWSRRGRSSKKPWQRSS